MVKNCVIPECPLEDEKTQYFGFPESSNLLDQWLSKMPLLNFTSLNFKEALICEYHFYKEDCQESSEFYNELVESSLPEYFPGNDEFHGDSCRFCLRRMDGNGVSIDDSILAHYKNLMQEELSPDKYQSFACGNCEDAIRKASVIKSKIQDNQLKLKSVETIEIKEEFYESLEELESELQEETHETIPEETRDPGNPRKRERKKRKIVKEEEEEDPDSKEIAEIVDNKYCSICKGFFQNLARHVKRIHDKVRNFECDYCGARYFTKVELKNHIKAQHQNQDLYDTVIYICEICQKECLTESSYKSHLNLYHLQKGVYVCEICGLSFTNKSLYESHIRAKHTGERPFQCPQCNLAFCVKKSLKLHVQRVHSTETFKCMECPDSFFRSKLNLNAHIRRQHWEKRYVCDWEGCDQKFAESNRLKIHINTIHYNLREHECEICGKAFKKRDKLKRHILQVHTDIKFNCEIKNCKAQFPRKDNYKNHLLRRHQDIGEEIIQKLLHKV